MKASRKHHYSIAQNHCSPTAFPTTSSQIKWGRPMRGTELLRGTDSTDHQLHLEGQQVFASCLGHPS